LLVGGPFWALYRRRKGKDDGRISKQVPGIPNVEKFWHHQSHNHDRQLHSYGSTLKPEMSGIEAALGVAASASQLIAYGKSILVFIAVIYERLQDAPQHYREYGLQLKLLIHLAHSIEKTPALQIPDVQCHLDATSVEVSALQSILCSPTSGIRRSSGTRNYWTLIKGVEEKQISVLLDRLNFKNTGLLLCINTVNTVQLSGIQGSVDRVEKLVEMSATHLQSPEETTQDKVVVTQMSLLTFR
jgi:hypothetical protein